MKTNLEFVEYVEKAYKEKWGYLWGAWGQVLTNEYLQSNLKQYDSNMKKITYVKKYMGNRVSDCYGLYKGFLWKQADGSFKIKASEDVNTLGAFQKAFEKGSLSTMPDIPGIILYMPGHVGVYIGNGQFRECKGDVGMASGTINMSNKTITSGNKFTSWFKPTEIEFVEQKPLKTFNTLTDLDVESEITEKTQQEAQTSNYIRQCIKFMYIDNGVVTENMLSIVNDNGRMRPLITDIIELLKDYSVVFNDATRTMIITRK